MRFSLFDENQWISDRERSPAEKSAAGAGAGGGFAALTCLTDNVLCLYSRSEYGTLRKKNFRTESIARYSFSSPSSAKPCG